MPKSVAIIGMSCRFPGAPDVETFWRNLEQGVESLVDLTEAEMLEAGVPPALLKNPLYVKKATPLEHAEWFDAAFFGLSPREAEILDPQHRVFLECAWEALEDSGYGGEIRPHRTGVYAGSTMGSYLFNNLLANREILDAVSGFPAILATDKDFLATRVSYKLNLKGPSLNIQTACSTSLAAVQTACQSLLAGQCDLALAGGVSIIFPQKSGYLYSEGMVFSPDGHCRPFDADAKGMRCGRGAGVVVLKRLEDAVRDGDSIHAVILGASVNNDGAAKMGYSAPSVEGQAEVISAALQMAGVDPRTVHYVETHGTGTEVGDPIEIAALERAFRATTDEKQFCALGAVKSNIGHLDAAAGVAGLIKTVLVLRKKKIPATLNFKKPNPKIDFASSPFYVNRELSEWPAGSSPRRAGLSSFGIGGTNVHAVLEEGQPAEAPEVRWPGQLLVLSARTGSALEAMRGRLAHHLEAHPEVPLADACFTLQTGRVRMPHRLAIPCSSREDAIQALLATGDARPASVFEEASKRPVAFLFSGQGSQYAGMTRELYEFQPVFREEIDRCAELLKADPGHDLRSLLYSANSADRALNETFLAQPALFAVEYALARMWMSWGVHPAAMIGHSIGEYTAACLAGVFSLEDALRIVAARGRIMQKMPPGAMLAVQLSPERALAAANGEISLAAVNSPSLCTLAGPGRQLADVKARLEASGIECRSLHTSHAFHSAMMDGALEPFEECLRQTRLSPPSLPFLSNLTGTWIRPEEAVNPAYWVQHLRRTVRFADGIREIAKSTDSVFLEVGPGRALGTFTRDCLRGRSFPVLASLPGAKEAQGAASTVLATAGRLWSEGVPINWQELHRGQRLHRVSLPTYFFERQRYWVEPQPERTVAQQNVAPVRKELSDWFYTPSWTRTANATVTSRGNNHGPWLIFEHEPFGGALKAELDARGDRYATVRAGADFASRGNGEYTIDPTRPADYISLFTELQGSGLVPRAVLSLWGLQRGREGHAAFDSMLFLAQALGETQFQGPLDLLVVTSGIHAVNGDEKLDPERALILGPVKVIPREYPNITCRSVDIDGVPAGEREQRQLAENLLCEAGMPRAWRPVAYRRNYRWEQTFEPAHLPERAAISVRQNGVYLITGGFGGIGLTLAGYLAEHAHARLALLGRTPLPDRSQWGQWIETHPEDDPETRRIREVERLEALGAEVLPVCADVSDHESMAAAIQQVEAHFGPIHGAIHAAGIAGGGLIQLKTPAAAGRVLASKVEGTRNLYSLLRHSPLDFLVLCSSVEAICPTGGAVDYASANAFLDAFAAAQSADGAPVFSINWDAWQQVGMAVNTEVPRGMAEHWREFLAGAIRPAEGIEAFRRVLAARLPQIAVVTRDLPALIQETGHRALFDAGHVVEARHSGPSSAETRHARPNLATALALPETDIQKTISEIWLELLGIQEIGIDDDFFELGGHSLMATGILSRVRAAFGVSMPLRTIFEAPTIRQLSRHVDTLVWAAAGKSGAFDESCEREEVEL